MGWSNQIPPQIQTLQDGTTQFSGPIVVIDPVTGKTVASIDTAGGVNGGAANFDSLKVRGVDIGTAIANVPQGIIGEFVQSIDSQTVNNGTMCLIGITNVFPTNAGRRYEFIFSGFRLEDTSSSTVWEVKLLLYSTYPTAANYTTAGQLLASMDFTTDATVHYAVPPLIAHGPIATRSQNWLGVSLQRVQGTGTGIITSSTSQLRLSVKDTGVAQNFSSGLYDPIPYVAGSPPAPPKQSFNVNYGATWSQSYDGADAGGNAWYGGTTEMYQGPIAVAGGSGHGSYATSAMNFDYATIGGNLSGATNIAGTLFIHNAHSWYNGGTLYNIYSQNTRLGSAPGNFSGISGLTLQFNAVPSPNPGWFSVDISSLLPAFATNTLTGFAFQAATNDLNYYGYCDGATTGFNPFINVKWTK